VSGQANCPVLPNLAAVPGLPRDEEGAVFAAPWEAKAFALVVHLHQQGRFEWQEWVDALSGEVAADAAREPHQPYYELWLSAAEKLMSRKGLVPAARLASEREALRAAQAAHAEHHDHGHHHDHGDHHH